MPPTVVPTTFIRHRQIPTLFYSRPSASPIVPITAKIPRSLWAPDHTPIFLEGSEAFYQYLLGPPDKLHFDTTQKASALTSGTLLACSDGFFNPRTGSGRHGWVMALPSKEAVMTGSGPISGDPMIASPYRAELSGLVATLYLIYKICAYHDVSSGKLTLYCDNNGAINNVFYRPFYGINSFIQSDYDLIQVAKNLCQSIPINITATWVKGHSQAIQKTVQEDMNIQADLLAGRYAEQPDPSFLPNSYQIPPPHYKVRIIHHNKVITAQLYRTLQHLFHSDPLRHNIMKRNNISAQVMDLINWDAFSTSFKRLTRNRKIRTAKLVHHLINTNVQNNKYYGSSSLCPCCQEKDKTFAHVLQC
jgi:hypothetical protein